MSLDLRCLQEFLLHSRFQKDFLDQHFLRYFTRFHSLMGFQDHRSLQDFLHQHFLKNLLDFVLAKTQIALFIMKLTSINSNNMLGFRTGIFWDGTSNLSLSGSS